MPEWISQDENRSLEINSETLTIRFRKDTGEVSGKGIDNFIRYEDRTSGIRRIIIAEHADFSEDSRYVYLRVRGRMVERTESMRRRREERRRTERVPS